MEAIDKFLELDGLIDKIFKAANISGRLRLKILFFVSLYENLSVSMIIEKLGIKKSNFALMTRTLEEEGLIEGKKATLDKRCRTLALTEKGRAELEDAKAQLAKVIGATSPEIERSIDLLVTFFNKK